MGENIYMLPSDMNLNIRSGTVGYNNKILVSDEKFSLGKNDKVNALLSTQPTITHTDSKIKSHKVVTQTTAAHTQKPTNTHEEEKITLILSLFWDIYEMVHVLMKPMSGCSISRLPPSPLCHLGL